MTKFYTKDKKVRPISSRKISVGTYQKGTAHLGVPKRISSSSYQKLKNVLYNGSNSHYIVLKTEIAKKNLDADVGTEAWQMNKKYVALQEDSGGYEWYGFNNDSDWEIIGGNFPLKQQVTKNDAKYLLQYGKKMEK